MAGTVRAAAAAEDAGISAEERFLKELYERCRMADVKLAAWLNGSCRVLAMDGELLELGFDKSMHMQKVDTDCRVLVEQQAEVILNRPVRLQVRMIEKEQMTRRPPRSGHLAEAARALGAVPVTKDS